MPISKELEEMFQSCKDMDKASELLDLALEYLPEEKWIGTTITVNGYSVSYNAWINQVSADISIAEELAFHRLNYIKYKQLRQDGYAPWRIQNLRREGIKLRNSENKYYQFA